MTRSRRVTEEQIAAAQLRQLLDEKQGRKTPDAVREIANSLPGDEVAGIKPVPPTEAPDQADQPARGAHEATTIRAALEKALEEHVAGNQGDPGETPQSLVVLWDDPVRVTELEVPDELAILPEQKHYRHYDESPPADLIWLPHLVDKSGIRRPQFYHVKDKDTLVKAFEKYVKELQQTAEEPEQQ